MIRSLRYDSRFHSASRLINSVFSPIFATPTHPEAKGIGLDMLTKACKSTQMKVFALGGINENNYQKCLDAGASGVAAISMFKK
ncbi:MAG: thiamine phosphate synthase [Nostoc sp.]|uniref:thiamine phosphate synthase n=1 Tax=Nostoc sp. TaxID=1180 RepID=UPI002FF7C2EC